MHLKTKTKTLHLKAKTKTKTFFCPRGASRTTSLRNLAGYEYISYAADSPLEA